MGILSKAHKISVIFGRSESTFGLLQFLSVCKVMRVTITLDRVSVWHVRDTAFTIQAELYVMHSLTANCTYDRLPT